jgi:CheY-like chemotaxis protein
MSAILWKAWLLRDSAPGCCCSVIKYYRSMLPDPSQPKTVLIVEDNELNLKLLHDILEYHGYTVFTTRLGEPALEIARQHRPDLILMDIQLPDISGMEAVRRLKEDDQTRTIPIIAVTKPFNLVEFLKLVERWTTSRT